MLGHVITDSTVSPFSLLQELKILILRGWSARRVLLQRLFQWYNTFQEQFFPTLEPAVYTRPKILNKLAK